VRYFRRRCRIYFGVHNGQSHIEVWCPEDMVWASAWANFSPTKKFIKHGGKMQKDLEQKKKESEVAALRAAKAAPATALRKNKNIK